MTRAPGRGLARDESGAAAIEYVLLAALIAGVLLGIVASLGQTVSRLYGAAHAGLVESLQESE